MSTEGIQFAHGSGGGLHRELLGELIAPRLGSVYRGRMEAGAVLELESPAVALSSGSTSLDPIFFGNGDIGRLAICEAVNELAVSGALPRYLTLSLVLEQGLPIADLARVLESVCEVASEVGVAVLAGDIEVVRGGEVDKLLIVTAGLGEFACEPRLGMGYVRPGDAVIVTGCLGDHAIHMHSLRTGLGSERCVASDCAPLDGLVWNVLEDHGPQVHCMRTIASGGLAMTLNELGMGSGVSIEIEQHRLPIRRESATAAEKLGLDPLYLVCAGSICMLVDGDAATEILELVHWQPQGRAAQIVGTVREYSGRAVTIVREDGAQAPVEPLYGTGLSRL